MDITQIQSAASAIAMQTRSMPNPDAWKAIVAAVKEKGITGKMMPRVRDLAWELRRQLVLADKATAKAAK